MLKQGFQQKLQQKLSPLQIQLMKLIQLPTQAFEQKLSQEIESQREAALEAINKLEIQSAQDSLTIFQNTNSRKVYNLNLLSDELIQIEKDRINEELRLNQDLLAKKFKLGISATSKGVLSPNCRLGKSPIPSKITNIPFI